MSHLNFHANMSNSYMLKMNLGLKIQIIENTPQCLKMLGKVLFNIASEARYIYILSG